VPHGHQWRWRVLHDASMEGVIVGRETDAMKVHQHTGRTVARASRQGAGARCTVRAVRAPGGCARLLGGFSPGTELLAARVWEGKREGRGLLARAVARRWSTGRAARR
jgi:hypothetical protein